MILDPLATEDDYQRAKRRVDLFDAFIPLEYLYNPKILRHLQRTIPEYHYGLLLNNGGDETLVVNQNVDKKTMHYSQAFIEQLTKENEYDTKLYRYVIEKLGIEIDNG